MKSNTRTGTIDVNGILPDPFPETGDDAFIPSREWQDIPDWAAMPNGGEYKMNQATGSNQARWENPPGPEAVFDKRTGKQQAVSGAATNGAGNGAKINGKPVKEKAWKKYQIKSIADLATEKIDTKLYLLGDGWLERGSGGFVVGGSGVGKSVISFQMGILWGCGRSAFGITASNGPLRIAIFQAEDGDNDQRRMARMFNFLDLSPEEKELSRANCRVIPCNDLNGPDFLNMVDGYLEDNPTDLIIFNPLNSYLEGAAVDEETAKDFLRLKLNPILTGRNVGCIIMHHTPKQNYRDTSR